MEGFEDIDSPERLTLLFQAAALYGSWIPDANRWRFTSQYVFGSIKEPQVVMRLMGKAVRHMTEDEQARWRKGAVLEMVKRGIEPIVLPLYPPARVLACVFCGSELGEHEPAVPERRGHELTLQELVNRGPYVFTEHGVVKGYRLMRPCLNPKCKARHEVSHAYGSELKGLGDASRYYTGGVRDVYFGATDRSVYTVELMIEFERQLLKHHSTFQSFEGLYAEKFVHG